MGTAGKIPFSWPVWCGVAALAGFLAALLLVASSYVSLLLEWSPPSKPVLVREVELLILAAGLSAPALAQQIMLRQSGIAARFYYPATVLGGWAMLAGILEGTVLAMRDNLHLHDIDWVTVIAVAGLLLGCVLTSFLQALALPRSGRTFYFLIATPGAIVGLTVAISIQLGLMAIWFDPFLMATFAFGLGWAVFAAATGWPIRRAIERMKQGTTSS